MLHIANFIRKYWLIFAIVILYFFLAGLNLLPRGFNIFKKKHLLIDDTPVVIKEIREIGELTTSEFYGEVYADLNEVYEDLLNTKKDSIDLNSALYFQEYSGLEEYTKDAGIFRTKQLEYQKELESFETAFSEYSKRNKEIEDSKKSLRKEIEKNKDNRKEVRKYERRLEDLEKKQQDENKKIAERRNRYKRIENKYREEKLKFWENKKRRNLVYIGRGWVKAGINLKDITEDDIIIDEDDSSTIQIRISDPVILDADINPWFIYTDKKKVKGYEVFIAKTGSLFADRNFTDKEITDLKLKCKDKLRQNAIEKGLIENAKSSAVQTLENFFHLVGFNKVIVYFKSTSEVVDKKD